MAINACGSDEPATGGPSAPVSLAIVDGDLQTGPAGGLLAKALQVRATDASQSPVAGAIVRFRVVRGAASGTVTDTVAVAGPDGIARAELRLGTAVDTSIVEAVLATKADAIARFRAVATPAPRLDAIVPSSFAGGDTVRLRGQYLAPIEAAMAYFASERALAVRSDADTSLTVVVPPCLPAGQVSARVDIGGTPTNAVPGTFAGDGRLSLRPLEGVTVSGAFRPACLQLTGGGASYVIIPSSAASSAPRQVDYTLTIAGATPPFGRAADGMILALAVPNAMPVAADRAFDHMLRDRERVLATEARKGGGGLAPSLDLLRTGSVGAPPAIGSRRSFRVLSNLTTNTFESVSARLRYAGDHILLYVDVDAPQGTFTDAELRAFGDLFDRTLYDVDVRAFGAESDIDGNGRVIFLLTPVVNALTSPGCAGGFVTGFHYGLDLLPSQTNSNRGEIFYALVPDVLGTRSCAHTKAEVARLVPATFVHEFQHMISFGQHVVARGGDAEAPWLNEGLSHIAEELAGKLFESRFPPPAGRTDPKQLFPDSAQGFLTPNMRNAQGFLGALGTHSLTTTNGDVALPERGGAWLFLRWLGDQKGESIYGRLVQTGRTGTANVEARAGEPFTSLFGDFATALYTDSLPGVSRATIPARLRFTSRNLRQIFSRFAELDQTGNTPAFPFEPQFIAGTSATSSIRSGSMLHYLARTGTNEPTIAVRLSRADLSGFNPVDAMQVSIFRLPDGPPLARE